MLWLTVVSLLFSTSSVAKALIVSVGMPRSTSSVEVVDAVPPGPTAVTVTLALPSIKMPFGTLMLQLPSSPITGVLPTLMPFTVTLMVPPNKPRLA